MVMNGRLFLSSLGRRENPLWYFVALGQGRREPALLVKLEYFDFLCFRCCLFAVNFVFLWLGSSFQ